jgi:hypothetical protein
MEATAPETASASNWASPAAPADHMATTAEASSAVRFTLRLANQSRARKKRDPIEFSFHDLISFVSLCGYF